MSTTIDQKVVEMRFDNREFERNVSTTVSSVEKLKRTLNMPEAAKGLENVGSAVKSINFNPLTSAVETVQVKFSALQIAGITAITNLTNAAMNAGKRIVSALTIDPITTGFQEYETQINSVQTILANTESKGSTLSDVNAALNELNKYADMTIYNFTEMTRNIGTFTAAGVDLDKSVTSIKGIANLAAVSGSTSQQASTAMYQLSQALAAGKVQLMDWNSVVNAGMGGQVFQDALKRTATQMGTNVDALIEKYGSFRESLTAGNWLTAEVLTETLTQLSGAYTEADLIAKGYSKEQAQEITKLAQTAVDAATKVKTFTQLWDTLKEAAQSGWTKTWEIMVGDFEEAKEFLTELSDTFGAIIGNAADSRNNLLYGAMTSNWKKLTDGITEAGLSAEDFKNTVTEIGKDSVKDFDKIVEEYGSLEKAFKNGALSSDLLDKALVKMTGTSEEILKKLADLRGNYKTNKDIIDALIKAGYEYSDLQELTTKNQKGQEIALNDLSDAQLMSIGYTAEQVKSIRELAKYSELAGGSLKKFIDNVSVQQGREMLLDSLRVTMRSLIAIFGEVGKAWRDVFPPMTSEQLLNIVKGFRDFVLAIRPSEQTLDKLHRTFRGLFSILGILKQAISAVVKAILPMFNGVRGLTGSILDVTAAIGDWLYNLNKTIESSNVFNIACQGIAKFIGLIVTEIGKLLNALKINFVTPSLEVIFAFFEKFHERMSGVGEAAGEMKFGVTEAISAIGKAFEDSAIVKILKAIWDGVTILGTGIVKAFRELTSGMVSAIGDADFSVVLDILNGLISGGIGLGIMKFLKSVTETFEGFGDIKEGIVDIFDGVRGCFEAYQTQLKAEVLKKIAVAIAILAGSIFAISTIDSAKLNSSLGAITTMFVELMGAMALVTKGNLNPTSAIKTATLMIAISSAVLILAGALKVLSSMSVGEMAVGLTGVFGLMGALIGAVKLLGMGSDKTLIKGATKMVIFAYAIRVLSKACIELSSLDWNELAKGLVGVGILLAEVSLFLNTAKFSGKSIVTATGIVILSGAIVVLAKATAMFASMSWGDISKGLASVGALLLELSLFTRLTGNAKNVVSTGIALVAIAGSMVVFSNAMKEFASMSWGDIGKGLASMAGALTAVTIALRLMPKNVLGTGAGLVVVAGALALIANAMSKLGGLSWEEVGRGLVALGGSMVILAVGLNLIKGTLGGSAALMVAAAALALITPTMVILGSMSWEGIAKGLVALGGALTVIGVAGALLAPVIPAILGLAGSFALIGVGIFAVGAGLVAAGAGLSAIAVGVTALAASVAAGVTAIVASVDSIAVAVKAIVLTIVDVFVECVPAIAKGALELIAGVLDALVEYGPRIIDGLFTFVLSLLQGLTKYVPDLVKAGVELLFSVFVGIVDALKGIDAGVLVEGIVGVGIIAGILAALAAITSMVPAAMLGVLGVGAIIAEIAVVLAAIGALQQIPGLTWLIGEGGKLLEAIGGAVGSLVGGLVGGVMKGVTNQLPEMATNLSNFMKNLEPFISGAKLVDKSTMDGIKTLADAILVLTKANVLDGITSWFTGGSSITKFAEDIVPFGRAMRLFSNELKGVDGALITNAALAGKALAEMAATLPNSGGALGFFSGENDMDQFASQLIPFGSAMRAFSVAVKGIDSNAIVNSTVAAKALVELANNLPNSGGALGFFSGDNDIDDFGSKLVPFGFAMRLYSTAVKGIDAGAIVNSSVAAKSLSELVANLPNSGGMVSWFAGDNDIGKFGESLIIFGRNFASYSTHMKMVDPSIVTQTANAASSIVSLQKSLPKDVGWFSDEKTLSDFGSDLEKFGKHFGTYYGYISVVDTAKLRSAVAETGRLIELTKSMSGVNSDSVSGFSAALTELGKTGIDGFISAFTGSMSRVSEVASKLLTTFIKSANDKRSSLISTFSTMIRDVLTSIRSKSSSFNLAGNTLMIQFASGVRSQGTNIRSSIVRLMSYILQTMKDRSNEFNNVGRTLMIRFGFGVSMSEVEVRKTVTGIVSRALDSIRGYQQEFTTIGVQFADGLANGISANSYRVAAQAMAMASAAAQAARKALDIHSPSKVAYGIGNFFGLGFVNALSDYGEKAFDAGTSIASKAKEGLTNAVNRIADIIDSDIDIQPTIRPVLDLTNVKDGAYRLNSLLSRSKAISISTGINRSNNQDNQNGDSDAPIGGNTYNFTQNNYSPKALSRVDIYRQTKNQFSTLERMVKA